jgi:hypothetical protein
VRRAQTLRNPAQAGDGGRPFYLPILNVLLGFDLKAATALSHTIVSTSALASTAYGLTHTSPTHPDRPLADLDLVITFVPALLFGVSFGAPPASGVTKMTDASHWCCCPAAHAPQAVTCWPGTGHPDRAGAAFGRELWRVLFSASLYCLPAVACWDTALARKCAVHAPGGRHVSCRCSRGERVSVRLLHRCMRCPSQQVRQPPALRAAPLLTPLRAGVLFNVLFPEWLQTALLVVLLGVVVKKTAGKGVKQWQQEQKAKAAEAEVGPPPCSYPRMSLRLLRMLP